MTGLLEGSVRGEVAESATVLAALDRVRDPELDEPITELGFVSECSVSEDGRASVHLRLPTFFCAPAKARPTRDQSMARERMCDEQSITSGASEPSAARSGRVWNSTPSIVSLEQTCR